MKYSLRSLMVVVTLVAMVLGGRVEYLRRGATYHEREAHRWAVQTKEETGYDPEIAPAVFMRSNLVSPFPYSQYEAHDRLAREYRHAVSRPWTVVKAPMPPMDEKEMWNRILCEIRQVELRQRLRAL
jgi:hypothetical protein